MTLSEALHLQRVLSKLDAHLDASRGPQAWELRDELILAVQALKRDIEIAARGSVVAVVDAECTTLPAPAMGRVGT